MPECDPGEGRRRAQGTPWLDDVRAIAVAATIRLRLLRRSMLV